MRYMRQTSAPLAVFPAVVHIFRTSFLYAGGKVDAKTNVLSVKELVLPMLNPPSARRNNLDNQLRGLLSLMRYTFDQSQVDGIFQRTDSELDAPTPPFGIEFTGERL